MGYIDLKICRIRANNQVNGRNKRMKKLIARKSAPAAVEQTATSDGTTETAGKKSRYMNWKLKAAAEQGDVEHFVTTLEKVLTKEELHLNDILDQRDHHGNTYLHVAAMYGRLEVLGLMTSVYEFLILLKQTNNEGDTALHIAVKAGHFSVTDLLISCSRVNLLKCESQKNEKGNTPLNEALIHNRQHMVDLLLHWGLASPWLSCSLNNEGKSSIYISVETQNVKSFNSIWKAAVCTPHTVLQMIFDEQLIEGRSLLHAAISHKDKVMLQEILAKEMHMLLHVKDENGQSPIEFASTIGFQEGENILRIALSKDTTDTSAVDVNQEVLEQKLDVHCSSLVDELDEEGIIRSSDWYGRHERIRNLLRKVMLPHQGLSHHCMDHELYKAAKKGDVDEFISALEEYSREHKLVLPTIFSQITPMQNTFLHLATMYENQDISWLIVQYFPSLLLRANSEGDTALHLAVKHGHLDIVEMFVRFRNEKLRKEVPIKINFENNDPARISECMRMVVENDDGNTPWQIKCPMDIREFLIKENVEEAYRVNKKGTSAVYVAVLNGETKQLKDIFMTASHYVDQCVLDEQLTKGKSLVLAAIWSKKIEILQELARQKPIMFNVKDEHAQKLVQFAEFLGFHEGENYLLNVFKLEIVLDNTMVGVVPMLPQHSYSLDAFSLSVIQMVDPKIEDIRHLAHRNGRDTRMKKLICNNSLQHMPQRNLPQQFMDVKLYEAAKKGGVDDFIVALENVSEANSSSLHTISEQSTLIDNTLLHVAASRGNEDLTSFICFYFRNLLCWRNQKGNTASHEAARAGHLGVVGILVSFSNYDFQMSSIMKSDTLASHGISRLMTKIVKNTSLHEAFINNRRNIVEYLIKTSVEEAYHVNSEGKSGLYLAVEAGNMDFVKSILSNMPSDDEDFYFQFISGKSLVNAAIRRKNIVILQEITRKIPIQIHITDEDGQTPLFCAVSTGFLEGVTFLLDELKLQTSQMNSTGFFPVHIASKSGHVDILEKLIQNCPDAGEFVNHKGQNILHVAAMYGKDNVVRFVLQTPDLKFLINGTDHDGNTPLHLATLNWHPKVVSFLTWDHRVNLALVNKNGLTALDSAEECMEAKASYQQVCFTDAGVISYNNVSSIHGWCIACGEQPRLASQFCFDIRSYLSCMRPDAFHPPMFSLHVNFSSFAPYNLLSFSCVDLGLCNIR